MSGSILRNIERKIGKDKEFKCHSVEIDGRNEIPPLHDVRRQKFLAEPGTMIKINNQLKKKCLELFKED